MKRSRWTFINNFIIDGFAENNPRPFWKYIKSQRQDSFGIPPLKHDGVLHIIIIISGFGIYGAAVVPDSGVGNTWQRLTLVLQEFLSNGLTPPRLHIVISFLTHADHVFLGLWPPTISGAWKPQTRDRVNARSGTLYVPVPPKTPSAKNSRDLV